MTPLDRPDALSGGRPQTALSLDYIDVGELLETIRTLLAFSRVATFDEEPGERDAWERATAVLNRYRAAT